MWRRKLKKISSVLVVLMFGIQLILNAKILSGLDDFAKNLIKVSKKDADDVGKSLTKNIGKSEKTIQSKIDDIPITIKQDETKLLIFNKADEIINKGNFEKAFFLNKSFDEQKLIIQQSSKYGDEYFVIAKKLDLKEIDLLSKNNFIVQKLPISKYANLTSEQLENKYIETLKYTGEAGWKTLKGISKFAKDNPKLTGIGAVALWYTLDPESFDEALKASGQNLTDFIFTTVSGIGTGMVEGVKNNIEESLVSGDKFINLIVGIGTIVLFFILLRKRKIIYHFLTKADEIPTQKTSNQKKRYKKDEF